MSKKTSPPSEAELRALRSDAAANAAGAHAALGGNKKALDEWRRKQVPSSDK